MRFSFTDHEDRQQRSHMEENRPPQPMQPLQPQRPPPGTQHHIAMGGGGPPIKKEAEVDPIAATN